MKEMVNNILEKMKEFEKDATSYVEKGNKAAARRARKYTLELEKLMKEFRKASVEDTKAE